jgi:DNA-binding HxlR family transcriptional regulator
MKHTDKTCVSNTLKIIGSKWTPLLLRELCESTKRFGELQRALTGISPRTLSLRLQQLEKDGIVKKKVFAEIPLHVEYSLTSKGQSLREIINKMHDWGHTYQ